MQQAGPGGPQRRVPAPPAPPEDTPLPDAPAP
jgi:hypothetical protein